MMSNKKHAEPIQIGLILLKSLKKIDFEKKLKEGAIWNAWDEMVGKRVAKHSMPESLTDGLLVITVSDPIWMQQLQFMKEMIINKVNENLKESLVKKIYFKLGECISPLKVENEDTKSNEWSSIKLSDDHLEKINFAVKDIKDSDLQKSIERLMIKATKLKKFRKKT